MGGSRRLPWVLVGVLAVAVLALVVLLLMRDDDPADEAGGPATPSDTPSVTASAGGADDVEQTETDERADDAADDTGDERPDEALPLRDPGDHLPSDGVSDIPAVGADLVDGDFFSHVTGADPTTMLLEADVEVIYFGAAADAYLLEHDPTAEIPPPNGLVIVNESSNVRQVPMADDIRIWDWCFGGDGQLSFAERSLEEWRLAPADGDQRCDAGAALGHGAAVYWLQVRDGEVKRVIGQYLP